MILDNSEFFDLTPYEHSQIEKIKEWKKEEPGVLSKAFGIAVEPAAWLVHKVVPEAAIKGALDLSNQLAKWLTDAENIKKEANIVNITDLKTKDLELSDRMADTVHNWAIGLAVAEGGGTGLLGLPGMAADIPTIITIALRTIHKVGICYGYEPKTEEDKNFVYGIMAASGANSVVEKITALTYLRTIEVTLTKQTWKKMAEIASQRAISNEAALLTIKNLAKQLGINITKRKALASIPFIGAAIGGTVNGWYIKEVGWAARHAFQERWLIDNRKIVEI